MRFLVHVVEETSIHKKIDGEYQIQECEVEDNSTAHILLSDSFYVVEAKEPVEAVIEIANVIRAEDEDGDRVKLGLLLKKQKEAEESDKEVKKRLSNFLNKYIVEDRTKSDLFSSTYEIEREVEDERVLELHKIFFYVSKESDIMQVMEK